MGKELILCRSVITPDPNLSIRQLGVPLKIAKNITKPVVVNESNKDFLRLVRTGLINIQVLKFLNKNGESISLRYVDEMLFN